MHNIPANSPADAWVKGTKYLLENGVWINDILEILNVSVSINPELLTDEDKLSQHQIFDPNFRHIFGDERIDYAQSVTFISPTQGGLFNKKRYVYLNNRWKDSYWGRMVAYQGEINQIENAIYHLSQGRNIKRCQIMVYDPIIDMKNPYKQPCLLGIDLKPRDGKLFLTAFFRSQRISKSGYADYMALCKLAKFLAKESKLKIGTVESIACSFHLHKHDQEMANSLRLLETLEDTTWQF